MVKVQNFSEKAEPAIRAIGEHYEKVKERPEMNEKSEREIVKETLQSLEKVKEQPMPTPPSSTQATKKDEQGQVFPKYIGSTADDEEVKKQVEQLLGLVLEGKIIKALREAREKSPFIEDTFHDALVDKLIPELKKRGIIKS